MITFTGKHSIADVFVNSLDEETTKQISQITNHPAFDKKPIKIMPDTHAGKGCVIGFTCPLGNDIVPNIIGVDIGCSMTLVNIGPIKNFDLQKFDNVVKNQVPMGKSTHGYNSLKKYDSEAAYIDICKKITDNDTHKFSKMYSRVSNSVGSLGGGNHFLECNIDEEENIYVVVHTGSRYFGKCICEYYQAKAEEFCKKLGICISADAAYLPIEYGGDEYIEAMKVAQKYASLNHQAIIDPVLAYITKSYGNKPIEFVHTVHNYINFEDGITRKGAISAHKGQKLIIPLNMRDGTILAVGKGNPDWNYSAPHGAGRLMSRGEAKRNIKLEDFKASMEGIYSSTVGEDTIDESPFAYKPKELILEQIGETIDVLKILKPIYNVKSGKE
jgi:RNA-splicing ligase RtcB